ncbi:DUF3616 domain-containing protein [Bradyrhizobium sp. ORS 285]|uniref:DUF3616 domain-containing protein n=1 Tax=Bradyrhizobium sp. ORS 285 TaxID=115808 RepID=UPI001111B577|nr:DUF3616 domain-containing protein [Bradyrhizobium sp. ORS 285]
MSRWAIKSDHRRRRFGGARMKRILPLALLFAATSLSSVAQAAEPSLFGYREMCNASAAAALDKDHFVVADDELNVLRVYRRNEAASIAQVDLSSFLGTKPSKESDIEGAARVGNLIFWISSHGTNRRGEVQDRRRRFFATEVVERPSPTVRTIGKPYAKLVEDLAGDRGLASYNLAEAATRPPKASDALNIEGLADGGDGSLLIGFRNPLPGGKALVVPLLNPTELIAGTPARFGAPVELDLAGRGVRSIERVGSSFLIVAGPIDQEGAFELYAWPGPATDKVAPVPTKALAGLFPEALIAIPDAQEIQILSDDGKAPVGGKTCEKQPRDQQAFRSVVFKP